MKAHTASRPSLIAAAAVLLGLPIAAQCPEEPPLAHWTGAGTVVCPCFVVGEEAGVVFTLPAAEYPVEITKVRIGWGSQFGGAPQSLEAAIHLYAGGLPNPGSPQFTVLGPALNDGFINEFDLTLFPGDRVIDSGTFTVTLEFLNGNAGDIFAPSVVHDGNGCTSNANVVNAIPGGWFSACVLGVTGDWVFDVVYRKAPKAVPANGSGVNPMTLSSPAGPVLGTPWTAVLDCSAHAPGPAALFGYKLAATSPFPTVYGEFLLNPASPNLFLNVLSHGGGSVTFSNTPPLNLAFCGFELAAQGLCFGNPSPQFSNMLAVRAGS